MQPREICIMRKKKGINLTAKHYGAILFLGVIVVALVVNASANFAAFNINDDFGFNVVIDNVIVGSYNKDNMITYESTDNTVNFDIDGPSVGVTETSFDRSTSFYPEVGLTLSSFRTVQDTGTIGEEGAIYVFDSQTSAGIITDYYKVRMRIRVSTFASMVSTSDSVVYTPDLGNKLDTNKLPEDRKISMILDLHIAVSNPADVKKGVLGLYEFTIVDNPVGIEYASFVEARNTVALSSWGVGIGEVPREQPYAGEYANIISTPVIQPVLNGAQTADISIPIDIGAGGYFDGTSWIINDASLAIETEMLFGLSYSQYNTAKLSWLGFLADAFPSRLSYANIAIYAFDLIIMSLVAIVGFAILYYYVLQKRVMDWET
jgi:hypothetical protein